MRKSFGKKPILYPQPVFIIGTWNADGSPNAMNAAWGGISEADEVSICVDTDHRTAANLKARGAFTVSMGTAPQVVACDYVGIVSGDKQADKVARAGWTAVAAEQVDAPYFAQLPMALECRVRSYDEETCRLVGEVVNVSVDESVLTESGSIDPDKLQPIIYDGANHQYRALGGVVAAAFSCGKALK
ncbi:MAG: flavin reductase family protein [Oscillospiraceae bacterium]|nr:flavin reductase family protein [Oscillospiraceae bacterium]